MFSCLPMYVFLYFIKYLLFLLQNSLGDHDQNETQQHETSSETAVPFLGKCGSDTLKPLKPLHIHFESSECF